MYELRSLWPFGLRSVTTLLLVVLLAAAGAVPAAAQAFGDESTDTSSSDSDAESTSDDDDDDDDDDGIDEWENDILKGTAVPGPGGALTGVVHALLRSLGLGVERPAGTPAGAVPPSRR
ncbi:MAG: hypothetical protein ACLF0P_01730 [Thermoanaerobaculia bacterium]